VKNLLKQLKHESLATQWVLEWEYSQHWRMILSHVAFSPEEWGDMLFYAENPEALGRHSQEAGTGNPFFHPEDTFYALQQRLSPEAKKLVERHILPHFKVWKEKINALPYMHKIYHRAILQDIYVPHFYSQKKGEASSCLHPAHIYKRSFLTYREAWTHQGKRPRFMDLREIVRLYDRLMIRVLVQAELIYKIKELEKQQEALWIIEGNSEHYESMQKQHWVECQDLLYQNLLAKSSIWETLGAPILLHPELARFLFQESTQSDALPWRIYDRISDFLKSIHVSCSGFHYLTLLEESAKSSGWRFFKSYRKGALLLQDRNFMREFIAAGGVVGHHPETVYQLEDHQNGWKQPFRELCRLLQKPSRFLFEKFHPRLKVAAFFDMREEYLKKYPKKHLISHVNQEIASLVNDMFGGQRFEIFSNPTPWKIFDFDHPQVLKAWRRMGGYVDWTISAIREFIKTLQGLLELLPGIPKTPTGTMARRNFFRYSLNLIVISQILSLFTSGFVSQPSGAMVWEYRASHITLHNDDPLRSGFLDIPLPDVRCYVGGRWVDMGRDLHGRRLYTHFGKKFLENLHYFQDPIRAIFNKLNPIWQIVFVQAMGGAPTLHGIPFKEQPLYVKGGSLPWRGQYGVGTWKPRLQHILRSMLPYSLQGFVDKGWRSGGAHFIATMGGSLPLRKGIGLESSKKFYKKYLEDETRYAEKIATLDHVLRDYHYTERQIQAIKWHIKATQERSAQSVQYRELEGADRCLVTQECALLLFRSS